MRKCRKESDVGKDEKFCTFRIDERKCFISNDCFVIYLFFLCQFIATNRF
jgi:hypothetical protein